MKEGGVLLLRRYDGVSDKFHKAIRDHQVKSLPILDFKYINVEQLKCAMESISTISGIIFTSKRAVDALFTVSCEKMISSVSKLIDDGNFHIFCVGHGTAQHVHNLFAWKSLGAQSGKATTLARYITDVKNELIIDKPLLFLSGNLAFNTLVEMLSKNGIRLERLDCYETFKNQTFDAEFQLYLECYANPRVIVFFSPSGCSFFFEDQSRRAISETCKIIAIGQTTKSCLENLDITVHLTLNEPTPECLSEAINEIFH